MRRGYSRRVNVEEKRNLKSAYLYVVLSIVAVIFLFFLGLPTLIKFAAFFTEVGKSDAPVDKNDITPPAPPYIERNIESTNKKDFKLQGNSEDGAVITLTFNESSLEAVANSEGGFNFDVQLKEGENSFTLVAKDQAGNSSQPTDVYIVNFDDKVPELTIESPADKSSFYGAGQRQLVIKGKTSADAEVYVNDRFVSISEDQSFSYATTLSEGENKFDVKAKDPAGNETVSSLIINFSL